jgi:regulatory protein
MITSTITTIEPHRTLPDRWHVSLDGTYAFSLDGATVVAGGLTIGRTLSGDEIEQLRGLAEESRVLDAALRFLESRPRSRAEVRRRLLRPHPRRAPIAPELADRVLDRLTHMGLLDDQAFAEYWVEQRERFSPRGAYALSQELRQRGVDLSTAEKVAEPERDAERALASGRTAARRLRGVDYPTFRNRLGQYLLRRGFGYSVARETIRVLWEELAGERTDENDEDNLETE